MNDKQPSSLPSSAGGVWLGPALAVLAGASLISCHAAPPTDEVWFEAAGVYGGVELQRGLVLSLGETKGEDALKVLTGMLKHPEPRLVAAAAESLGQFAELESEERKKIFKELLKTLVVAHLQVASDPADSIAREWWNVVSAPLMTSMSALSGRLEKKENAKDWLNFWNKNAKRNWDKG